MRCLKFIFIVTLLFFACSSDDDQVITNSLISPEYFSHVEDLTFPEELYSYAGYEGPILLPYYNNNYPAHIITAINYLREDMGSYMDKLKPKLWWEPIDSLIIDNYGATLLNSHTYISEEYFSYSYLYKNYYQFTETTENHYYWLATEMDHLEDDVYDNFQINEFAWQNSLKTSGGIDRYYDSLEWIYTSDSLIVDIPSFNNSRKLSLSLQDYSGSLIRNYNDSTYIYKWNGSGNGSYLAKHTETGLSLNPEEFW